MPNIGSPFPDAGVVAFPVIKEDPLARTAVVHGAGGVIRRENAGPPGKSGFDGQSRVRRKLQPRNGKGPGNIGVFGLGAIGLKVANAAKALGLEVIGYDPFINENTKAALAEGIALTDNTDDIFVKSDYITLHAPLNDATRGIVCAANLAKAKDGVRVLNFARGELVDNADILAALASGKCAAYATDFPTDDQLQTDGVIAIPHLGASTPEAEENCAVMAVCQLSDYLLNGNVKNSVNFPALSAERAG